MAQKEPLLGLLAIVIPQHFKDYTIIFKSGNWYYLWELVLLYSTNRGFNATYDITSSSDILMLSTPRLVIIPCKINMDDWAEKDTWPS